VRSARKIPQSLVVTQRVIRPALDRGRPGTGDRVAPLLGPSPAPLSFEGMVTALINALAVHSEADEALLVPTITT